jgi:hypothetical protein
MTVNKYTYYVYLHTDPVTKQVVYVGKGCNGRAWDVTRCRNTNHSHMLWMKAQIQAGFVPSDWVSILAKGLSEKAAFTLEKEYLYTNGVLLFNRQSGERQHQAKLKDKQAIEIFKRANAGEIHRLLAKEYGVSRNCISMIATRKQWKAVTCTIKN